MLVYNVHVKHALTRGVWRHTPQKNFRFSALLRWILSQFQPPPLLNHEPWNNRFTFVCRLNSLWGTWICVVGEDCGLSADSARLVVTPMPPKVVMNINLMSSKKCSGHGRLGHCSSYTLATYCRVEAKQIHCCLIHAKCHRTKPSCMCVALGLM